MTVGENGFGPPGSRRGAFSVGSTEGAVVVGSVVVVVVVVVSVVVSGASPPPPHAAVSETIPMIAAPPAVNASRRANRDLMMPSLLSPE
ncbi:MAG: hypothetical protein JST91_08725 [Actinobacteria bacterium]|nr:hypothetical protein [Actinomycetota bacterium]